MKDDLQRQSMTKYW